MMVNLNFEATSDLVQKVKFANFRLYLPLIPAANGWNGLMTDVFVLGWI